MEQTNWTEEAFNKKPELVILFDRLARLGRAMQRARAKVDRGANSQDNVSLEQKHKIEEQ